PCDDAVPVCSMSLGIGTGGRAEGGLETAVRGGGLTLAVAHPLTIATRRSHRSRAGTALDHVRRADIARLWCKWRAIIGVRASTSCRLVLGLQVRWGCW